MSAYDEGLTLVNIVIYDSSDDLFYVYDSLRHHLKRARPTDELRSNITQFSIEKLYSHRQAITDDDEGLRLCQLFCGFFGAFLSCIETLVSFFTFSRVRNFKLNDG